MNAPPMQPRYAIIVSSALNYFLLGFGIKNTTPVIATALSTLQPVATAILSFVFFGTVVSVPVGLAGAAVCIGLLTLVAANVRTRTQLGAPAPVFPSNLHQDPGSAAARVSHT